MGARREPSDSLVVAGSAGAVRTTTTRNAWLASHFIASGLTFLRGPRMAGPHFRVVFVFSDPDHRAPALTKQFLEDRKMQKLINARRLVSTIMEIAAEHEVCLPSDLGTALDALDVPWSRR
jgi:hypothetical protein